MPLDAPSNLDNIETKTQELFVSKKIHLDNASKVLQEDFKTYLGIKGIKNLRIFNNYVVDSLSTGAFEKSKRTIFSEAPVDDIYSREEFNRETANMTLIPVESIPGQYDNRVDAVQQNLALQTGENHKARFKQVIAIEGDISSEEMEKIRKWVINPVEKFESHLDDTSFEREVIEPENHVIMKGFINFVGDGSDDRKLEKFLKINELSISIEDLKVALDYFKNEEKRDPTKVEMLFIDTYWSDHCRHTTFNTKIEKLELSGDPSLTKDFKKFNDFFQKKSKESGKEGNTFMEIATASFRLLKDNPNFKGKEFIDVSIEDNAASYKTSVELEDGSTEEWIIMFKNETHNSPTEVEPFGGAATCLGGAIRDTLSGRAFTFGAMRVSGSADPTRPVSETDSTKISQRAISIGAALGYSSYGNQIGLATGKVEEYFHPDFEAKRFECGYVIAAVKEENLVRKEPKKGDVVIMAGGFTGRDGVGGANVSSKESGASSSKKEGSHVQKGNPTEERPFQRINLDTKFTRMVKRCNDFGAGGISVAIGELSRGLNIDLDAVAKHTKYDGLSDDELAISEAQERMSYVVAAEDEEKVLEMLRNENIRAFRIAEVTNNEDETQDRLVVKYQGKSVVDMSRDFLDKNGAERTANAKVHLEQTNFFETIHAEVQAYLDAGNMKGAILKQLSLLENSSQRGLQSIFDASVGASTILAPFGGKYQSSAQMGMANKIPTFEGVDSKTGVISVHGFHPYLMNENEFLGGMYTIIESISKIAAMGGDYEKAWLSLQEYFGKLTNDEKYGKVYAGLLGTLKALWEIKVAAIGGKDSMSGTRTKENGEKQDVPSTIVSFANAPVDTDDIISSEFKEVGSSIVHFKVPKKKNGTPDFTKYIKQLKYIKKLMKNRKVLSSSIVGNSGVLGALSNMSLGNKLGFNLKEYNESIFTPQIGDILLEIPKGEHILSTIGDRIGTTMRGQSYIGDESISVDEIQGAMEGTLEGVWPTKTSSDKVVSLKEYKERKSLEVSDIMGNKPVALLPVFPGTNSELDTRHALLKEGFAVEEFVFKTRTPEEFKESRKNFAQMLGKTDLLVFPGGFSAGDEPDGSAKLIANTMRSPEIKNILQTYLADESKLTVGICNGFQALIKMGVFENSELKDELAETDETLTYNKSLKHETGLVRLKVASILSPFMSEVENADEFIVPISHGEGNILISEEKFKKYQKNGQIPLQYLDEEGNPTNKYNGSYNGIAALTSPNGNILGMMPHPERTGRNVFKNVPGEKLLPIFRGAYKELMKGEK